jgi:hypothetical protein
MEDRQEESTTLPETCVSLSDITDSVSDRFNKWLARDGRKGYYEYELGNDFYILIRNINGYEIFLFRNNGKTENMLNIRNLDKKNLKIWVGVFAYIFKELPIMNIWQLKAGIIGLQDLIVKTEGHDLSVDDFYLQRMFIEFVSGWYQDMKICV